MRTVYRRLGRFVLEQLAGAGFASALFALFALHISGYDPFEWAEAMNRQFPVGLIFYVYGLGCSTAIALIGRFVPGFERGFGLLIQILLYMAAGYAYFLVRDASFIGIIAGTIAAMFALAFFVGKRWAASIRTARWCLAAVVPLALLALTNVDFTVKKGWTESTAPGSYEAGFDYFNGKHEISFALERGETLVFEVKLDNANGGGHGMHVLDENDEYAGMREAGTDRYAVVAARSGTYRIVLTGDDLQGNYRVEWTIEKAETDSGASGA